MISVKLDKVDLRRVEQRGKSGANGCVDLEKRINHKEGDGRSRPLCFLDSLAAKNAKVTALFVLPRKGR